MRRMLLLGLAASVAALTWAAIDLWHELANPEVWWERPPWLST